jgi:hypothetical protein
MSEGTAAANNRWTFGYCNSALTFAFNTGNTETIVSAPWAPTTGAWFSVSVTRIDYQMVFAVNGAPIGSSTLVMHVLPQPNAPLLMGRATGVTTYFNGLMDEISMWNRVWIPIAKVDPTVTVTTTAFTSGVGSPSANAYIEPCATYTYLGTGANVVMRMTMLSAEPSNVVDFYRPLNGVSLCNMLRASNQHLWSASAAGPFSTPTYPPNPAVGANTPLGGSAANWPHGDVRPYISFWGAANAAAGCCSLTYQAATTSWGMPYVLSVAAPKCPIPNPCFTQPCQNGGTCVLTGAAPTSLFTCSCVPGYSGTLCQTLNNNCAPNPCQNGATCTNGVNTYTCTCPAGGSGLQCQNAPNSALSALSMAGVTILSTPGGQPFSSAVLTYTATVTSLVANATIVASAVDPLARIQVSGFAAAVGTSTTSQLLVYGGVTRIAIFVFAQTPSFYRVYNLTVTQTLSTDTTLASVVCTGFTVTGAAPSYTVTVTPTDTSIVCTATTTFGAARVAWNAQPSVLNSAQATFTLSYLNNVQTISVTSENNVKNGGGSVSYTLTVVRPFSTNALLTSLRVVDGFGVTIADLTSPANSKWSHSLVVLRFVNF